MPAQAARDDPNLELVCAVCRRTYPNTAKGRAQAAEHWPEHVGKPVDVELEGGGRIYGTAEAGPVFELHEPGKGPKLAQPKPKPKGGRP
jgi:hypothetical protein